MFPSLSQWLESFRIHFAGRPLVLWLALLVAIEISRTWKTGGMRESWIRIASVGFATVILAGYILIAIWYATVPYYFDNAEPTIPSVAWIFHTGGPLYHALDSAERYAHIYGPFAFITHAWALSAFGPSIQASKAVGAGSGVAAILITLFTCRARTGRLSTATMCSGGAALALLLFRNYSFWTRPDPLQVLSATLCLTLAAFNRANILSDICAGAVAGFGWDLRFTGPLYTLVPFGLVMARRGPVHLAAAITSAVAVAAAPFVLYSNVSWGSYLLWVHASSGTGLLLAMLRQNIEWALFLCVPLLLVAFPTSDADSGDDREWRMLAGLLSLGICGIVLAASKPGAGPYHLLPFVPVITYLVARRWHILHMRQERLPALAAWVVIAAVIGVAQQAQFLSVVRKRARVDDAVEIATFCQTHTGIIEMGYGSAESLSHERPLLVFRSGRYLLDQPAIREHQLQGIGIPPATLAALDACRVNLWLIPRGEPPFSRLNAYSAVLGKPLYDETFRSAFLRTHRLVDVTAHFDVWRCIGAGK